MADSKLTDLLSLTAAQGSDLLYVVSLQETLSGESKKMSVTDFFGNVNVNTNFNGPVYASSIDSPIIVGDNITTNKVTSLSATFNSVIADFITPLLSTNLIADYTLNNGRIYNFNTSSSNLSVILPSVLPNGFNIGITNIGTNTVYISSTQVNNLCAISNRCSTQFSSIFIYKANGSLFGVGKFN